MTYRLHNLLCLLLRGPDSEESANHCNILQTQDGLKLRKSSLIKLSSVQNPGTHTNELASSSNVHKGFFEIANHGKQMVAYKILVKPKAKLGVKPGYGFIMPNETEELRVTVQCCVVPHGLSVIILATPCIVVDQVVACNLQLFWDSVVQGENKGFVDVLEVNQFSFYKDNRLIAQIGVGGIVEIGGADTNAPILSALASDINNNNICIDDSFDIRTSEEPELQSSWASASSFKQPDSERISTLLGNSKVRLTTSSVTEMKTLSKEYEIKVKAVIRCKYYLMFFIIFIYLFFVRKVFCLENIVEI